MSQRRHRVELDARASQPYCLRMSECPHCRSQRIVTGRMVRYASRQDAVFRPDNLGFLTLTVAGGVSVGAQSYACRECGLMWTFADKEKLNRFLEKHCDRPE